MVAPMFKARSEVNPELMGFSPIPAEASILLERGSSSKYDAMLHIYVSGSERTISFRKTPNGYKWIAEQEVVYGPGTYQTVDGVAQENIVIEYQIEPLDGIPINQQVINYAGSDSFLSQQKVLTLATVRPILEKWKGTPSH